MAERLTRKEKVALQKQSPAASHKEKEKQKGKRRTVRLALALIAAITGFVLYANTLGHEYVLDDYGLIVENTQTRQGISAVPEIFKTSYRYGMNITDYKLYRPVSKAMFAIEWGLSPDNPALGHLINVILYALTCFVLVVMLSRYMKDSLLVPFITALLFAAHPLHTEVVANIKSRDEIVCFLFCISALWALHSYIAKNSRAAFIGGIACYFLALFTKESAITFLVIVPLFYYFFTEAPKAKYVKTLVAMGLCTVVFLLIRNSVLSSGEAQIPIEDNSLVAIKNFFVQRANAVYLLGVYLYKFIYPHPLISDGSYNTFPAIGLGDWRFLVPFVVLVGGLIYALMRFRKKDPASLAILYFFITASIGSNVIMLIGTNYGERLMFIPSLGIFLLFALLIEKIFAQEKETGQDSQLSAFFKRNLKPVALIVPVILIFGYVTMARNMTWKDNLTLYTTDIRNVPNSAHMHYYIANQITSDEYLNALPDSLARDSVRNVALYHLTEALKIHPKYADSYQRRGYVYKQFNKPDLAEKDYIEALKYNPTHPIVFNNYGSLCFNQGRMQEAMEKFQNAIRYNPRYAHAYNNLGSVYGVFALNEQQLMTTDPANKGTHAANSRSYFESAAQNFRKAIEMDASFADPYRFLGITYRHLGDVAQAEKYERLHQEVMAESNAKN